MYRYRRLSSRREGPPFLGPLFVVLLLLGIGFLGWKTLPFWRSSNFGQFERYNFAIIAPSVYVVSVNVKTSEVAILPLPDNLYLPESAFGYGQYRISSLYGAGNLDKRGGETVTLSLQEFLGVPINGYIKQNFAAGSTQDLRSRLFSPTKILRSNTNLSIIDLARIIWLAQTIREDKIKIVNLEASLTPLILADGSTATSIEPAELDSFLNGSFVENNIRQENFRVEVVNTTKVFKLASRVARLLSNIGVSVVNFENQDNLLNNCEVQVTPKARSAVLVLRIANIYSCKITPKSDTGRADVTVLIGQDYAEKLGL